MTPEDKQQPSPTRGLFGLRLAALSIVGLGGIILTQVPKIGSGAGYSIIGPRIFPWVVGIFVLVFGILFFLRTTVWLDEDLAAEVAAEEATTHWPTTLLVMLALVVYATLLHPLGYTLSTALFFPITARILGSKKSVQNIIIGLALGLLIYLTFTHVLGVRLPAGILGGIL